MFTLMICFMNSCRQMCADDTTPYTCNIDLPTILRNLEHDSLSAIIWFEANYMKLNQEKCHFMIAGNTHEFLNRGSINMGKS